MIRTIHALVMFACLLGFAGNVLGQDPVTQRPGDPESVQPMATPKQAPKAEAKLLATLEGREEWGNNGKLSFAIYEDGKVVMVDATEQPVTGKASADGKTLTLAFGNCVYEATESNGVFTGKARYTSGP